ncbi:MAG TPA: trigger factor [Phycisphaerales bacterium]|nr:trigger factor [Phycisphaerales bacterium]
MSQAPALADPNAPEIKVEDVGPARKRLTITIPAPIVDARIRESMGTLLTQTALPGFRKGHVPESLLRKRFGDNVKSETRNQLVASAYAQAIERHALKPLSEPTPVSDMDKLEVEEGKPLSFAVEVEIIPDFELPSVEGVEIKKPMLEISESHINDELKRQQMNLGKPHRVEDDFKPGDRLGGHAKVWRNDETDPFFQNERVLIVVPSDEDGGKGQIFGLIIDDMAAQLKGKKVGDTVTFNAVGPEAHEREDIRGAKLRIEFSIKIAERVEPAEIPQVVEHYGLQDEAMLREQIQLALEHRRDEEQAGAMREQLMEKIADLVEIPMPEKLTAAQAERNLEHARLELMSRGVTPDEIESHLAEMRADSETASRARLKNFFLMLRFAEKLNIQVSEQEVNGRIALMAAQRGVRPDKLKSELQQSGRSGDLVSQLRDQKTADRLVSQAKLVEISADEWNKILTERNKNAKGTRITRKAAPKSDAKKEEKSSASEAKAEKPAAKGASEKKASGKKKS